MNEIWPLRQHWKSGGISKMKQKTGDKNLEYISSPVKTVRFGGNVEEILTKYKKGDLSDYELMKNQLADPEIKDAQIISWLQEFRSCVTQLNKDHEQLIYTILRLPWIGRSQPVVLEYMMFLSNLVSAQTVYLCACLRMVVSHFTQKRVRVSGEVEFSDSDDETENFPRNFDQCHQALQLIIRYVPATRCFLMPILQEKFPFIHKSPRTLECYVHNLLRVTLYIPSLQRDILELIVEKMLKLDVSASRSDIEEAEENAAMNQRQTEQIEEGLFVMDDDMTAEQSSSSMAMAHEVAEKLDVLMVMFLTYIKDLCHVNGCLQMDRTKELFKDLLSVFDKLILPTHASCHIQYALFYLCSFKLSLGEAFLDHLWKILHNPSQPALLRQAAAGFLGSFLARAKFIPLLTVRACLDLLFTWIHQYISSQDSSSRPICCDISLHGPFYSACQAAFYILIFRHRAILEGNMKKGLEYLQSLNLERVVMSPLNPLKVCLPSVTNMFAAITRKYQVVFCYTIMERNNRLMLPVVRRSVGDTYVTANTNPLDSVFPFDPYLLKRSGQLIKPLYQEWEELVDTELHEANTSAKVLKEDDDEFLCGEKTQTDGSIGITPTFNNSSLCSPGSMGSPLFGFQESL